MAEDCIPMPPARSEAQFGNGGIANFYALDSSIQSDRNEGIFDGFLRPHTLDQQI